MPSEPRTPWVTESDVAGSTTERDPRIDDRVARRRRRLRFTALSVVVVALSVVAGFEWYLRSDRYRDRVAAALSDRLRMYVSIGRIRPLGLSGRVLRAVRVAFEPATEAVFSCSQAVWETERAGGSTPHVLALSHGTLWIAAAEWTASQYRRVLAGGFGHDFRAMGLGLARLEDFDIHFGDATGGLTASGASGVVFFDERGAGRASLNCYSINGVDVAEPISITARFTSGSALMFEDVRLSIPAMSMRVLGLERIVRQSVTRGTFAGTVTYRQSGRGETVELSGSLTGADLAELTSTHFDPGLTGTANVDLHRARIVDRRLDRIELRGDLSGVGLAALAPALGVPVPSGSLDLEIDDLLWRDDRLAHLSARGVCFDLSLTAVTEMIGQGSATGRVAMTINALVIVDEQLRLADATFVAVPPPDTPGTIDRDLLARVGQAWLGLDLTGVLPERVEYERLGLRMVIHDDALRIYGTHGDDGRTILTVKILGQSVGVIRAPDASFPVSDLLARIRRRARAIEADEVREWWERVRRRHGP